MVRRYGGRKKALASLGRVLLVGAIALTAMIVRDRQPRSANADPAKPNIVLILTDDQTFDSMAMLPFLGTRPGGHWVEFSNAFINTSLCCPSRASILSGQYSHHTGVIANDRGASFNESSTLATDLNGAGYRTMLEGKYLNHYPFNRPLYIPPGWTDWFASIGDPAYYNYTMNDNGTSVSFGSTAADYQSDVLAARAEQFIDASGTNPFFLYASFLAPHPPYTPAPRHAAVPVTITHSPNFNEADVSDKPLWIQNKPLLDAGRAHSQDVAKANAFRSLLSVDEAISRIWDALIRNNVADNTVIVFMTDNGRAFGEHRHIGKGCVYEECSRTNLLIRDPLATAHVESSLVSNVDLAPTFAQLAGTVPGRPVDGISLVPLLRGTGTSSRTGLLFEYAVGDTAKFWGIRTANWAYSELYSGERELYDMVADPFQLVNKAGDPAYASVQSDLAAQLAALKASGGPTTTTTLPGGSTTTKPPKTTSTSHATTTSTVAGSTTTTTGGAGLRVSDTARVEGNSGTATVQFTISLGAPAASDVTVQFGTVDGTARAPGDYTTTSGSVTIPAGQTSVVVNVAVVGDTVYEANERFSLVVTSAPGVTIVDNTGVATITNDDTKG
jgi:arylsulfatase A-like enzyme